MLNKALNLNLYILLKKSQKKSFNKNEYHQSEIEKLINDGTIDKKNSIFYIIM